MAIDKYLLKDVMILNPQSKQITPPATPYECDRCDFGISNQIPIVPYLSVQGEPEIIIKIPDELAQGIHGASSSCCVIPRASQ